MVINSIYLFVIETEIFFVAFIGCHENRYGLHNFGTEIHFFLQTFQITYPHHIKHT